MNELKYILWSNYQNLRNPGRYRGYEWESQDIAMRHKTGLLKEQYPEELVRNMGRVAEEADETMRYQAIQELKQIEVKRNNLGKEELKQIYEKLPSVGKDGQEIEFSHRSYGKIYKEGGLFGHVIPELPEILTRSELAYSEKDNRGGEVRPDGIIHKNYPNVESFDDYVGKVSIEGKDYYARLTVQNTKMKPEEFIRLL